MVIVEAEQKIREIMQQYLPDWEFRWDKATRRFGCCYHNLKRITVSKTLTELNEWVEIKDTLLHEIAHALVGEEHGHDSVWREKCIKIGARPQRCFDNNVNTPAKKWIGTCPACGRIIQRERCRNISCGKCCKTYNPMYKFVWSLNKKGDQK